MPSFTQTCLSKPNRASPHEDDRTWLSNSARLTVALVTIILLAGVNLMVHAADAVAAPSLPAGYSCPSFSDDSGNDNARFWGDDYEAFSRGTHCGLEFTGPLSTSCAQTYRTNFFGQGLIVGISGDSGSDTGVCVQVGNQASNLKRDGSSVGANYFVISATTSDGINSTVEFDHGGQTFHFQLIKQAGTNTISGFTIQLGAYSRPKMLHSVRRVGYTVAERAQTIKSLQNNFSAATPSVLGSDGLGLGGGGVSGAGGGITFAPGGASFAYNSIASDNPMDRDYGPLGMRQDYYENRGPSYANAGVNFSLNLQQFISERRKKEAARDVELGLSDGSSKGDFLKPKSKLVTSVSGRYAQFDDDTLHADRSGSLWYVTTSVGYKFSDDLTAGVFTRYREGDVDSVALASSLSTKIWGGGVFLEHKDALGLRFVGVAMYEIGENDIEIGGATGMFDSESYMVAASLDKKLQRQNYWLQPQLQLVYHRNKNDEFTDSAANTVNGQTDFIGRLTYGPQIGTTIERNGVTITPFAKVQGIWDFARPEETTATTGALIQVGEHALTLGGGVDVVFDSGLSLRVASDWFTYDTNLQGWSVTGGLGSSFAAIGLASHVPGYISLDLNATAAGASTMGRVKIPLGDGGKE